MKTPSRNLGYLLLCMTLSAYAVTASALTITSHNSGIEWSGALSLTDEYDDGLFGSATVLDILFQPGPNGDSVSLTGASASSSGDVDLQVLDQLTDFAIYSNLSAIADLSLATTGGAKPIEPADAYAVADAFVNIDFNLSSSYNVVASSDLFDAMANSDGFFSVMLTDVTHNLTLYSADVNDASQSLAYAGLLGPGDYSLALSANADISGFTGSASATGDFLINLTPVATVPVPAAVWLFFSGLALLASVGSRRPA